MQGEATTQPAKQLLTIHGDRIADVLRHGLSQSELLTLCREANSAAAILLILAGLIFLLWGLYAFKTLVVLNAACVGGWLGYLVGQRSGAALPAAVVGAFVAGAVAWPMMKYAVAIMGGLIGTVIGMTVWRSSGLDPAFAAAGGGMGLIFFGMLSFILFRTSVMMFTSLQGACMLTFGLLCLVYKLRLFDVKLIDAKLVNAPMAVPIIVGLAAIIGVLYQNNDTNKPAEPAK
jgi:hypothetical protein